MTPAPVEDSRWGRGALQEVHVGAPLLRGAWCLEPSGQEDWWGTW